MPVWDIGSKSTFFADGRVQFPLVVSANGRYLQDQAGAPFRIHGDSGWEIINELSLSDVQLYLDDRKARGFNTIRIQITNPTKYWSGSNAPKAFNGELPFLKNASGGTWDGDLTFAHFDADFSTPNDNYFAWVDTVFAEIVARNMAILVDPCYLGYNDGASDGWFQTFGNSANTNTVCTGFGTYLGNRYKSNPNILWCMGTDTLPGTPGSATETKTHKVYEGIVASGASQIWSAQWVHDYLSTDVAAYASNVQFQAVYTHGNYPTQGPTYGRSRLGYSHTPAIPAYLTETAYEDGINFPEHGTTVNDQRYFMWGAVLSCIGGTIYGNGGVWLFGTGWQTDLSSTGAQDMDRMRQLLDGIPWYQLVPSALGGMKTLVTSGQGTFTTVGNLGDGESGGMDWIVAAANLEGSHIVCYVPNSHSGSFSVDMTVMRASCTAKWFDPSNGTYSSIGSVANTGTHSFTIPGTNSGGKSDWVLFCAL